jgi:hypothetical protein
MRSVMERADRNMVSDVVEALQARLQRRRWSDDVSAACHRRTDLLVPLWMMHPSVGMKQARAIRPTHNARKEVEKWATQ